MAVPFGSLVAARPRVLPQSGHILGQLTAGLTSGFEAGQQRRYAEEAPDLIFDYLDAAAAGYQQPTLGNLTPPPIAPFDGRPTRENAAAVEAVTPGSPTFDGRFAMRRENAPAAPATPAPAPGGGSPYRDAISNIESGGDYSTVGPVANASGDRAYGRYQVMGANVGPWTEQVLGYRMTPQEFLANPQAQDAVFDAVFGGYVSQYGPDGAARAWFTGSPTGTGTDVLGTTADNYVAMFNGGGGGASSAGGGQRGSSPSAWSPPSEAERQALRAMIANPLTREQGIQLATQRMTPPAPTTPNFGFQEVNGVLYATDPTTGRAVPVAGSADAAASPYGFVNVPGVGLVRTNEAAGTAETAIPTPDAAPNFNDEEALRDNFRMETDDYRLIQGHYQRLQAAAANPSAAGDIAMVYAFMKMLDPTSVVRETEYATAQNAAGVPVVIQNLWNRLLSGERLAPEQRNDFLTQAQALYGATQQQFDATVDRYRGLATQYQMDPDRVLGLGGPSSPANGAAAIAPIQIQTPQDYEALPPGTRYVDPNGVERIKQ